MTEIERRLWRGAVLNIYVTYYDAGTVVAVSTACTASVALQMYPFFMYSSKGQGYLFHRPCAFCPFFNGTRVFHRHCAFCPFFFCPQAHSVAALVHRTIQYSIIRETWGTNSSSSSIRFRGDGKISQPPPSEAGNDGKYPRPCCCCCLRGRASCVRGNKHRGVANGLEIDRPEHEGLLRTPVRTPGGSAFPVRVFAPNHERHAGQGLS